MTTPLSTHHEAEPVTLGIREVAEHTGLSIDTVRWYEREGLLPPTPRGPDGRRRYDDRAVRMVELIARLRRTGMPVEQMRDFSQLLAGGAQTYDRRLSLLTSHRARLLATIAKLEADLRELDAKTDHYRALIAAGLDCTGSPAPPIDSMETP